VRRAAYVPGRGLARANLWAAGRQSDPLFLAEYRPGPLRLLTTDSRDLCPEPGRAVAKPHQPAWLVAAN
jgi:hypothetical protein